MKKPLFIFEASKLQFDIPTKAIFLSSSFKSYSNSACITFKGLLGECSARPISSKKIIDIFLSLSLFGTFFKIFLAFKKIFCTPFEVLPIDP